MAYSLINIAPAGALTQGQIAFSFDVGSGRWDFAFCKLNNITALFGRFVKSTGEIGDWITVSNVMLTNSSWLEDEGVKNYAKGLIPYALPSTTTVGFVYASNTALQTGLYSDGKGGITTTPATVKTTSDIVTQILTGSDASAQSGGTTDTTTKKWYQKPLTWIIAGVAVIGGYLFLKK